MKEILFEYWHHVGFFYALFAACLLFSSGLARRKFFWGRVGISLIVFNLVGYHLMPSLDVVFWLIANTLLPGWVIYLGVWLVHFLIVVLSLFFCFNAKLSRIWFCAVAGYSTESMSYGLQELFTYFTGFNVAEYVPVRMAFYAICFIIVYFILARKISHKMDYLDSIRTISASTVNLALILFIGTALESYVGIHNWILGFFRSSFCCISLFILFGVWDINKKDAELVAIRQMQSKQAEHYEIAKDMMGAINLKLHDLKYYALKSKKDGDISELVDNIKLYDANIKTGNQALDIILTEATLQCFKEDVRLSCMADGTALHFMEETDIYILFGNMLDNAREAVLRLENKEKRNITLTVMRRDHFTNIHCENYYDQTLLLKDGMPLTVKADKQIHGFGVKSIQAITEKYNGVLALSPVDETFSLDITFPIKD